MYIWILNEAQNNNLINSTFFASDWRQTGKYLLWIFSGIDCHNVAFNDSHGTACCGVHKVAMHLKHGTFPDESFGQCFLGQLFGGLYFLIPIAGMSGYVVLVSQFGRVRILRSEPVHAVLKFGWQPTVHLEGSANSLKRMLLSSFLLCWGKVFLKRWTQRVQKLGKWMVCLMRAVRLRIERIISASKQFQTHIAQNSAQHIRSEYFAYWLTKKPLVEAVKWYRLSSIVIMCKYMRSPFIFRLPGGGFHPLNVNCFIHAGC